MTTVTLNDGSPADSGSSAWREECLARANHVSAMRPLPLQLRRQYLATVERLEGQTAAQRLRDAFSADWQRRQGDEAKV